MSLQFKDKDHTLLQRTQKDPRICFPHRGLLPQSKIFISSNEDIALTIYMN